MSNSAPIDHDHLAKYTLNDRALEKEILSLFVAQLPDCVNQLRNAQTTADWTIAAHTIKGSARAVGAKALAEAAEAAERAVDDSQAQPAVLEWVAREAEITTRYVGEICVDAA